MPTVKSEPLEGTTQALTPIRTAELPLDGGSARNMDSDETVFKSSPGPTESKNIQTIKNEAGQSSRDSLGTAGHTSTSVLPTVVKAEPKVFVEVPQVKEEKRPVARPYAAQLTAALMLSGETRRMLRPSKRAASDEPDSSSDEEADRTPQIRQRYTSPTESLKLKRADSLSSSSSGSPVLDEKLSRSSRARSRRSHVKKENIPPNELEFPRVGANIGEANHEFDFLDENDFAKGPEQPFEPAGKVVYDRKQIASVLGGSPQGFLPRSKVLDRYFSIFFWSAFNPACGNAQCSDRNCVDKCVLENSNDRFEAGMPYVKLLVSREDYWNTIGQHGPDGPLAIWARRSANIWEYLGTYVHESTSAFLPAEKNWREIDGVVRDGFGRSIGFPTKWSVDRKRKLVTMRLVSFADPVQERLQLLAIKGEEKKVNQEI